jgi:predicted Zn-dependent peptidase
VDHDRLLELLAGEGWFEDATAEPPRGPLPPSPAERGAEHLVDRETAQVHVVLGTDTFAHHDARRFALAIITNVLGGGMSSRLFQRVREELGLAYAVYAFNHLYQSAGVAGVYVGTQGATADRAIEAIRDEYLRLSREGLPADDLETGKQQLKGQVMLALENPVSRVNRLAGVELYQDHYRPMDQLLAEIDAVSPEQVAAIAAEYFAPERQTVVRLGPS